MYTIKHAATQAGVSAATLRAWERRYALVTPHRTESGYRLYGDSDVQLIRSMKQLVDDGWSASLAATEAVRRAKSLASVTQTVSQLPQTAAPELSTDLVQKLISAAADLDTTELAVTLDQLFAISSFEAVMAHHVFPALTELGNAWADGRVSVAGEHLASHAVMRRLAVAYEAAAAFGHGPRVVLGMGPNIRHEIGLLAFAVAARRQGLNTDYLGADLPLDDWLNITASSDISAVVLAMPTWADVDSASHVVSNILSARPGLIVAVGGAEQQSAPEGALRLGDDIVAGAKILATHIAKGKRPVGVPAE